MILRSHLLSLPILFYIFITVSSKRSRSPNVVLILTDDQDILLGSMEKMPKTLRIMRQRGVEFVNGFVSTPICCASRSSILTGMYVHNHHVFTNNENCTGRVWKQLHEKRTFASYLHKSGYRTAYMGKYLNEYRGEYIPEGYSEWSALIKNSKFYNYSVNFNGKKISHGDDYHKDYLTDLVANDTVEFLQRSSRLFPLHPFLVVMSFPAPHGPEDPAPQYSKAFERETSHHTAAWNYAPNPDKQWLLQHTGKMEPVHVAFTDLLHRRRLQTLLSVDDAVHKVVSTLRDLKQLSNTYILYTSDHGYHLGQFGLIKGKNMPYEFDLKVPFFIRGPNVAKGRKIHAPVANIDIAPTILDMAGLPVPAHMDGRSILPLLSDVNLRGSMQWRDTLLIERGKMPKLAKIRDRLVRQRKLYSKEMRIKMECEKGAYTTPCGLNQQWFCDDNRIGRWRIYKCRQSTQKVCSCTQSTINTTRHRRNIPQDHLFDSVDLELLEEWEDEFYSELMQKDIIESGQWFQGVFEQENKRYKRSEQLIADDCQRLHNGTVYCSSRVGRLQQRIHNINARLKGLKVRRKKLKNRNNGKMQKDDGQTNANDKNVCDCEENQGRIRHPLKDNSTSVEPFYISDADLLRIAELTRIKRRRRGKTGTKSRKVTYKKKFCNIPNMNCFIHSADHWKTPPLWPSDLGQFCFCQNSNNNTYWCLRTVNKTHNFLYCEFVTGFISYYDLEKDPYQLHNSVYQLEISELERMSLKLRKMRDCQGWRQCEASATDPNVYDP